MKKGNFYRNLFEEVQKSSILNYSLIKRIIPRNELFIYKFLHERDLSTEQQKNSIPYHENHYYYPRNVNFLSRCFTSSRRSTGFHMPSSNEFHPIRDNPFAGSRKRGGNERRGEGGKERVKVARPLVGATAVVVERHYERGKARLMSPRPANATQRRYL